jgi:hypothetical protein
MSVTGVRDVRGGGRWPGNSSERDVTCVSLIDLDWNKVVERGVVSVLFGTWATVGKVERVVTFRRPRAQEQSMRKQTAKPVASDHSFILPGNPPPPPWRKIAFYPNLEKERQPYREGSRA